MLIYSTTDVARCRDGEHVSRVFLTPENVNLGCWAWNGTLLVVEVPPPVDLSMQVHVVFWDTWHHPYISTCFCGRRLLNIILVTKWRLQLADHCFIASGTQYQPASDLVFWQSHERFRVGQGNSLPYYCMLRHDTGLELDELRKVASNRDEWRTLCHRATWHW